jgi:hypothetical protein
VILTCKPDIYKREEIKERREWIRKEREKEQGKVKEEGKERIF